jgi:hypothetical protein
MFGLASAELVETSMHGEFGEQRWSQEGPFVLRPKVAPQTDLTFYTRFDCFD